MLLTPELVLAPSGSPWACCSRATEARNGPCKETGWTGREKTAMTKVLRVKDMRSLPVPLGDEWGSCSNQPLKALLASRRFQAGNSPFFTLGCLKASLAITGEWPFGHSDEGVGTWGPLCSLQAQA